MPKKSHRVAARQAAASKERKRKKRAQTSHKPPLDAGAPATSSTVATTEPSTAPPLTRPTPAARPMAPRYQYVIADLRKIGLIAGAMLVILIVLAFVLG